MKIQPYVQKLEASNTYKKFRRDYSESFLVAGFFILDYESSANMHQIDYYVPSKKKVAAFNLDGEVEVKLLDMASKDKIPEKQKYYRNNKEMCSSNPGSRWKKALGVKLCLIRYGNTKSSYRR